MSKEKHNHEWYLTEFTRNLTLESDNGNLIKVPAHAEFICRLCGLVEKVVANHEDQ